MKKQEEKHEGEAIFYNMKQPFPNFMNSLMLIFYYAEN